MLSTSARANGFNHHYLGTHRRGISGAAALIIVVAIIAIGFGAYIYFPPGSVNQTTTGNGGGNVAGNQAGKIAFQVEDMLAGTGNNAPTMNIFPAAGSVVGGQTYTGTQISESPTVGSTGSATTALFYSQGTVLFVKLSLSNYETEYWKVVAPGATSSQVQGGQWPTVVIPELHLPTITISLTDGSGNTYASAGNKINFTSSGHCTTGDNCLGVSSTTLSIAITNTAANTGYISNYDILNNVNWCAAATFQEGTSNNPNLASYSGMPVGFTVGSTRYYGTYLNGGFQSVPAGSSFQGMAGAQGNTACSSSNISQGGLTGQTVGTTVSGGSVSFKFTAGVGGLTHGQYVTDSLKIWEYGDLGYATANSGVMSPSAVQLGSTFTFILAA
jgi:hypothetical protein